MVQFYSNTYLKEYTHADLNKTFVALCVHIYVDIDQDCEYLIQSLI
jgi:hypothetical protein